MRKEFSLLLLALLVACTPTENKTSGKEQLKSVLAAYYEAMANKDLEKMKALTADSFIMFDEGQVYNNESALQSIATLPPFTARFRFDSVNARIDKANASAYYLREAEFTMGDSTRTIRFLESATFNKEKDQWKIRFLHSSIRK